MTYWPIVFEFYLFMLWCFFSTAQTCLRINIHLEQISIRKRSIFNFTKKSDYLVHWKLVQNIPLSQYQYQIFTWQKQHLFLNACMQFSNSRMKQKWSLKQILRRVGWRLWGCGTYQGTMCIYGFFSVAYTHQTIITGQHKIQSAGGRGVNIMCSS